VLDRLPADPRLLVQLIAQWTMRQRHDGQRNTAPATSSG